MLVKQGLLSKLKRKDKPKVSTFIGADNAKSFFEANGIDMENIGFPKMETRKYIPTEGYSVWFRDVKASLVEIDGNVSTIIKGRYETQARAAYQDENRDWKPGEISYYPFKIQNGELKI
jgi:hypothetical protein